MFKEMKKELTKDLPTIMKLDIKNAMTTDAKRKLEETKKEGYTKL